MRNRCCACARLFLSELTFAVGAFAPEEAGDGGDAGGGAAVADALFDKSVPDFPAEDGGGLAFVLLYPALDLGGGDAGLRAADYSWADGARFLERKEWLRKWDDVLPRFMDIKC